LAKNMALPLDSDNPPMEARPVHDLPEGEQWRYEPKWDGFRCLAFRDGEMVELRSKSGQNLGRYFPDVTAAVGALAARQFVLDGEIIIPIERRLSFEALQLRLHPAASRVNKLAAEHPAIYIAFDLLVGPDGKRLTDPLLTVERRSTPSSRPNMAAQRSGCPRAPPIGRPRSAGSTALAATSTASSPSAPTCPISAAAATACRNTS
jgi:ATP-dependent DNA ligase